MTLRKTLIGALASTLLLVGFAGQAVAQDDTGNDAGTDTTQTDTTQTDTTQTDAGTDPTQTDTTQTDTTQTDTTQTDTTQTDTTQTGAGTDTTQTETTQTDTTQTDAGTDTTQTDTTQTDAGTDTTQTETTQTDTTQTDAGTDTTQTETDDTTTAGTDPATAGADVASTTAQGDTGIAESFATEAPNPQPGAPAAPADGAAQAAPTTGDQVLGESELAFTGPDVRVMALGTLLLGAGAMFVVASRRHDEALTVVDSWLD